MGVGVAGGAGVSVGGGTGVGDGVAVIVGVEVAGNGVAVSVKVGIGVARLTRASPGLEDTGSASRSKLPMIIASTITASTMAVSPARTTSCNNREGI
jgi:hypothetical protein